ncbi:cold-shock protein [Cesiribacter sp. SM1]|uniref:cold-shock protein n=1 Tax=Cesiribacter sp. SM1 TaxID=2861196 RepID=UPI001CD4EB6B|nr:cold shock domain-containing protein [Cesiribacter sp. SM1]
MGRSQETFSKKEKEKNKLRKKKDKEQKREERKANADKGKSLDDMIMYVDENGNFSSTPPDPEKRKVKKESIAVSVPKQEAADPADAIRKGIVTFFNDSKGYGFIKDQQTQESIFVHINDLIDPIKENNKVTFEVEMGQKGPVAVKVQVAH